MFRRMRRRPVVLAALLGLVACAGSGGSAPDAATPQQAPAYEGSLRITPNPARVPETPVGCAESVLLRLDNESPETALTIERIALPNAALRILDPLPLTVAAGEHRFLDLHFLPTEPGDGSGPVSIVTGAARGVPYTLEVIAAAVEPPALPAVPAPLDLVFVVDVSTTMQGLPQLRAGALSLFDLAERNAVDLRIGLVTFVNDVVVHDGGAFLDRAAFLRELDSQLNAGHNGPNPALPRHVLNFDFPENSLGALDRAAAAFAFRPAARRVLLLMTDDTFLEPPAVFSDGTPASVSLEQVATALEERGVRLVAIHASSNGRGFSSNDDGAPSLVAASGGTWLELADVVAGTRPLAPWLAHLAAGGGCD